MLEYILYVQGRGGSATRGHYGGTNSKETNT